MIIALWVFTMIALIWSWVSLVNSIDKSFEAWKQDIKNQIAKEKK